MFQTVVKLRSKSNKNNNIKKLKIRRDLAT